MPDVPCLHEHVAYLLVRAPRARQVGDFGLSEYLSLWRSAAMTRPTR